MLLGIISISGFSERFIEVTIRTHQRCAYTRGSLTWHRDRAGSTVSPTSTQPIGKLRFGLAL